MGKSFISIVAILLLTVAISGCNTFKGAGKDIENSGKSIQKTVDKND